MCQSCQPPMTSAGSRRGSPGAEARLLAGAREPGCSRPEAFWTPFAPGRAAFKIPMKTFQSQFQLPEGLEHSHCCSAAGMAPDRTRGRVAVEERPVGQRERTRWPCVIRWPCRFAGHRERNQA
jgi:hypothetical protein